MRLRALVVEADDRSRQRYTSLIDDHPDIDLMGSVRDPRTARSLLRESEVDVLILNSSVDPNALDLVDEIGQRPVVIVLSQDAGDALRCFDAGVVDMLLRPFSDERFQIALGRAVHAFRSTGDPSDDGMLHYGNGDLISIRFGRRTVRVDLSMLHLVSSNGNQVMLHLEDRMLKAACTMKRMEKLLPDHLFTRVHRMYIVADRIVRDMDKESLYTAIGEYPVGSAYRKLVKHKFGHLLSGNDHHAQ